MVTISLSLFGNAVVVFAEPLFHRGNANADNSADISDAIWVFNYLFLSGTAPSCLDAADTNDDGQVDISDGVYLLSYLFRGGPVPPAPSPHSPCPGPDPTPDGLGCETGHSPGVEPSLEVYATQANAPGVRERSRLRLPRRESDGAYLVPEGASFAILVEASSSRLSRAGFELRDPADPSRGNPDALSVTCDRAFGDPARGGVPAGENLASHFFGSLDGWKDAVFLIEHAPLRIAHDGPLAPAPGRYRFTASVSDLACGRSADVSFVLEVTASDAPELFAWIESDDAPGTPLPHHAGSGNARVYESAFTLVVEGLPRDAEGGADPDPSTLRVTADPAIGGEADVTPHFVQDPSHAARFRARFDPGALFPERGDTAFSIELATAPGVNVRRLDWRLERSVKHGPHVQPIWDVNCTGCHERPMLEKGLELVAPGVDPSRLWRNIVYVYASEPVITSSAPLHVWPYFPERSYLLHKLLGTHEDAAVGGSGVRMPKDEEMLTEETIHVVRSWIAQGAER